MIAGFVSPSPQLITILPAYRAIGPIQANVTVEESGDDELYITQHPVEQGATISDHAFKRPAEVLLRCGWSNSSAESGGDPNYVRTVYAQLLDLQVQRTLFTLYTGKRVYSNMLLARVRQETTRTSEFALLVTAICRQVILASTRTLSVSTDPSVQGQPQKTQAPVQTGPKQLQSAPNYNPAAAPQ
jgi:hypothetical protein